VKFVNITFQNNTALQSKVDHPQCVYLVMIFLDMLFAHVTLNLTRWPWSEYSEGASLWLHSQTANLPLCAKIKENKLQEPYKSCTTLAASLA